MTNSKKPMQAVTITPDGMCCLRDLGTNTLHGLYRAMECDTVDVVRLADDLYMWVDDEGMIKADPEINLIGTVIAHGFGFNAQPYFGTVCFTGGADEEGDTVSIPPERTAQIQEWAARVLEHKGELADQEAEEGADGRDPVL
jgi:hypothetical protein